MIHIHRLGSLSGSFCAGIELNLGVIVYWTRLSLSFLRSFDILAETRVPLEIFRTVCYKYENRGS